MESEEKRQPAQAVIQHDTTAPTEQVVNASGHIQELSRNFSAWSLIGLGLSMGNVWPALGGSILVALYNGGPPGRLEWHLNKPGSKSNALQAYYTSLLLYLSSIGLLPHP